MINTETRIFENKADSTIYWARESQATTGLLINDVKMTEKINLNGI